ncbi:hypothetical protein A2U01_0070860, partial [Trifolium medium]|nr:hypothetical protein [Trifolium medium]
RRGTGALRSSFGKQQTSFLASARCAGGDCALRHSFKTNWDSLCHWRDAWLTWRGAPGQNVKSTCITVNCALRRAYGAARRISF